MRITPDADVANITYNNQFFYANDQRLINQFYSVDGATAVTKRDADIMSASPKDNNPRFKLYDVDQFDFSTVATYPMSAAAMPPGIVTDVNYDFSLLTSSPAYHKGTTTLFKALRTVPQGGNLGARPGPECGHGRLSFRWLRQPAFYIQSFF